MKLKHYIYFFIVIKSESRESTLNNNKYIKSSGISKNKE